MNENGLKSPKMDGIVKNRDKPVVKNRSKWTKMNHQKELK